MGDKIHRRLFLGGGAGVGAWLSGSADRSEVQAAETGGGECLGPGAPTFGHTMLFMEEYHQATMEILGRLSGELDQVGELSSRAGRRDQAGRDGVDLHGRRSHAGGRAEGHQTGQSRDSSQP